VFAKPYSLLRETDYVILGLRADDIYRSGYGH
jgi:hypothetical protein